MWIGQVSRLWLWKRWPTEHLWHCNITMWLWFSWFSQGVKNRRRVGSLGGWGHYWQFFSNCNWKNCQYCARTLMSLQLGVLHDKKLYIFQDFTKSILEHHVLLFYSAQYMWGDPRVKGSVTVSRDRIWSPVCKLLCLCNLDSGRGFFVFFSEQAESAKT